MTDNGDARQRLDFADEARRVIASTNAQTDPLAKLWAQRYVDETAAAQGWQMVPIEPTEAMLHAATMIAPTWDDAASRAKYAAMLAAAPPSPAAQP